MEASNDSDGFKRDAVHPITVRGYAVQWRSTAALSGGLLDLLSGSANLWAVAPCHRAADYITSFYNPGRAIQHWVGKARWRSRKRPPKRTERSQRKGDKTISIMNSQKIHVAAIVDAEDRLAGILQRHDMLRARLS